MKVYLLALVLALPIVGCKSSEPAAQPAAAKCDCPDGKCQCKECQAGDAAKCSCPTKKPG